MESFIGLILLVTVIASLIFYKNPIKKTSKYAEDCITTSINEGQIDLIKRSRAAYENLIEEVGEDYLTTEEIYNRMQKRGKKVVDSTPVKAKKK